MFSKMKKVSYKDFIIVYLNSNPAVLLLCSLQSLRGNVQISPRSCSSSRYIFARNPEGIAIVQPNRSSPHSEGNFNQQIERKPQICPKNPFIVCPTSHHVMLSWTEASLISGAHVAVLSTSFTILPLTWHFYLFICIRSEEESVFRHNSNLLHLDWRLYMLVILNSVSVQWTFSISRLLP